MKMTFECNNFDGNYADTIEIVSSVSGFGLLKRSGNKNLKVCLPLDLCIGKLDSLEKYDRSELKKYINSEEVSLFRDGYNFDYEYKKLTDCINKASKIRVWSSHLDCDDYCLLLFLCYHFNDKNISVIYSEEANWHTTTIGCLTEEEVIVLLEKEHVLKKYEIEQFSDEWKKILTENSELRFMLNGTVKSVAIDYFDEAIIERLKNLGKVEISKLVADLMGNPIIPFVYYSDYIYVYLINRLIDKKLISINVANDKRLIDLIK